MKALMLGLFLSTLIAPSSNAQQSPAPPTETIKTAATQTPEQQEVINLSKHKMGLDGSEERRFLRDAI